MIKVWLDGKFLAESKARIPATDPGFTHGRGLFETIRAYDGVPFRLGDHVERMAASARRFKIPFKAPDLEAVVRKLCRLNHAPDARVRLTLSAAGRLLVTAQPRKPVPPSWLEKGTEVMVVPWRRDGRAPLCGHKTTNYWENLLVHEEALERGCADALFVGLRGELLEGAVTNVFLVLHGKIVTPRLAQGVLPGIARRTVLELAKVRERTVKLRELWKADEAFLTNSLIEVLPIGRPGPVTRWLARAYRERATAPVS